MKDLLKRKKEPAIPLGRIIMDFIRSGHCEIKSGKEMIID